MFGVWGAGGVHVPLNPRLTDAEVERVLATMRPPAVWRHPLALRLADTRPSSEDGGGAVRRGRPRPPSPPATTATWRRAVTSGATGALRCCCATGVIELIDGVLATLRGPGRGPGAPRPAAHAQPVPVSMSLWAGIYTVLFAFRVGAPVVVMDGFDTLEFARLVARFRLRSTVLPPAAMAMLVDDERVTSLEPLRYVRSITAPLSPLQARRFRERFGVGVLNGYGQTEIGGEIIGWSAADLRTYGDAKLGSVGRPHRGVEVRAVDPDGRTLGPDEPGELWVRTPALSAGYADGTDLGDRLTPDGWFRTGDVGRVDADGFVWIEGRVSDMINRGGLKVHPGEVEEVLRTVPGVADAAVVGVPDERLGEVPWAFVVAAGAAPPPDDELVAACRAHLAPYKVPVRFVAVDELPATRSARSSRPSWCGRPRWAELDGGGSSSSAPRRASAGRSRCGGAGRGPHGAGGAAQGGARGGGGRGGRRTAVAVDVVDPEGWAPGPGGGRRPAGRSTSSSTRSATRRCASSPTATATPGGRCSTSTSSA